jgi:Ca-activated chloride channel homolog
MRSLLPVLIVASLASLAAAKPKPEPQAVAMTRAGELPYLSIRQGEQTMALPLLHTHVQADVVGPVVAVEVTQTYQNPYPDPIEAVYVFPLPEHSAVNGLRVVIGPRVIEAEIKEREAARRAYEEAKQQGHLAALLEQERPNIFTQSIANIEPGHTIEVVVRYLETLTYDDGAYEFVFPMVVGSRYSPGSVADAGRLSPSVLTGGARTGHDVSLELTVRPGFPIHDFGVPTHEIDSSRGSDGSLLVRLRRADEIPNRDFILRYTVAGEAAQATVLTRRDERGGFFTMMVQPPKLDLDALLGARELVFVVDVSGSMSGVPLSMCQDAMEQALTMLRPSDTFNVITFAGRPSRLFSRSLPASEDNVRRGLELVRTMGAGGGTEMLDAVAAALDTEAEKQRNRHVFFLTDGYVGNEEQILAATSRYVTTLEGRGQKARVFGFGVGSSVNRHLLDGLSQSGNGTTFYSTTREDPALAVNAFFRLIDKPVIEELSIDWGGLTIDQQVPARLPDLFATRPLVVHGRFANGGDATIRLRGKAGGRSFELPLNVTLPSRQEGAEAVATLWARAKVGDLTRQQWFGEQASTRSEITALGLGFHLVTQYTSLIAVDRQTLVHGKARTITQPVEAPEGVDPAMAGAPTAQAPSHNMMYLRGSGSGAASGMGIMGRAESGRGMQAPSSAPRPSKAKARLAERRDEAPAAAAELAPELRDDSTREKEDRATTSPVRAITVDPGLAAEQVSRMLQSKLTALSRCAGGHAEVVLRFIVDAHGTVASVEIVDGDDLPRAALSCLRRAVTELRFAKPTTARVVVVVTLAL